MRYVIITLLICSTLVLGGCSAILGGAGQAINGSGNMVTKEYDLTGFDTVEAGSNFHVNVHRGDSFAVKVTADDIMIDHLRVTSGDQKLTLGIKPGTWSLNNVTMTADVTMPALNSIAGRSNAVVSFDQFEPANFTLDLSGNAIAEGELNAGKIDVIGDANAQARLAGATDSLDVRGKGNAVFTMPELEAKQVSVEMDNNSMAAVQATGSLDYALSGNAGLTYSGNPKLGKQQTGANAWAKQK